MTTRAKRFGLAAGTLGCVLAAGASMAGATGVLSFGAVDKANTKAAGIAAPNVLAAGLLESVVAQGSVALENPDAATKVMYYGYLGDGPMVPAPADVQSTTHNVEAQKTEPDKNTYLVMSGLKGADAAYSYGSHFLFQGHEGGSPGYFTRVNLDADAAHRVTLLATKDSTGAALPADFDGSTWDPFAKRLLFTNEAGPKGGVWQVTTDVPAKVDPLHGVLGQAGYEGVQADKDGNLWIVEDVGGPAGTVSTKAKQPNSFVYRLVPVDKSDLAKGGKLQALQVASLASGKPIGFGGAAAIEADITSPDRADLHTYGKTFKTTWVTVHDTAKDGTASFDANAAAKKAAATPFKRPENGVFRPGTGFGEFYFTETGDTNADTQAAPKFGGFGGVYKLSQSGPSASSGTLSLAFEGDKAHTGLDNLQFLDANRLIVVEDGGDTLHAQRNALDSAYLLDLRKPGSELKDPPRMLAEGRDASATIDSGLGAAAGTGFQNDGDNEITGIHVSNGDPTASGILGASWPTPLAHGWRIFWTQQHGDNVTYEITRDRRDD